MHHDFTPLLYKPTVCPTFNAEQQLQPTAQKKNTLCAAWRVTHHFVGCVSTCGSLDHLRNNSASFELPLHPALSLLQPAPAHPGKQDESRHATMPKISHHKAADHELRYRSDDEHLHDTINIVPSDVLGYFDDLKSHQTIKHLCLFLLIWLQSFQHVFCSMLHYPSLGT